MSELLARPAIKAAVAGLDLGSTTPTAPLFVYHAVNDELVPITTADATVANYCAHGGAVTYTRDELSEHITLAFTGATSALSWLTTRLNGAAVPHGCTTTTTLSMPLSSAGLHSPSEASSGRREWPTGQRHRRVLTADAHQPVEAEGPLRP